MLKIVASLVVVISAFCSAAIAQEFPTKPVRIIMPYATGSATDLLVRQITPAMSKILGQQVIVEPKPGASGLIAYAYVAKQVPADGYTLVIAEQGSLATLPLFVKNAGLEPRKDLLPIAIMAESPITLVSPQGVSWNSFAEMIAYAKANPGKINYATPGAQTLQALFADVFKQRLGAEMTVVPYKGGASEMVPAILANTVQLAVFNAVTAQDQRERIKVLGVTGNERLPGFPNVPTFNELGLREIASALLTLDGPAATPTPVVRKLHDAFMRSITSPEVRPILEKGGRRIVLADHDATVKMVADVHRFATEAAQRAGIKPE